MRVDVLNQRLVFKETHGSPGRHDLPDWNGPLKHPNECSFTSLTPEGGGASDGYSGIPSAEGGDRKVGEMRLYSASRCVKSEVGI